MSSQPVETRLNFVEQALAELARAQTHTQQQLDLLAAEMRSFKEEMRSFKEEMGSFKEERRLAEERSDRRWGELANKMGTLAEDIVAPGVAAVFKRFFGVDEPMVNVRLRARHRKDVSRVREFDTVASAGSYVLITETKSSLKQEDVALFGDSLAEAREFLAEAEGRKLIGAVASFYLDPSLVRAGERRGLLVLGLSRGLLEILNTPGFVPREV